MQAPPIDHRPANAMESECQRAVPEQPEHCEDCEERPGQPEQQQQPGQQVQLGQPVEQCEHCENQEHPNTETEKVTETETVTAKESESKEPTAEHQRQTTEIAPEPTDEHQQHPPTAEIKATKENTPEPVGETETTAKDHTDSANLHDAGAAQAFGFDGDLEKELSDFMDEMVANDYDGNDSQESQGSKANVIPAGSSTDRSAAVDGKSNATATTAGVDKPTNTANCEELNTKKRQHMSSPEVVPPSRRHRRKSTPTRATSMSPKSLPEVPAFLESASFSAPTALPDNTAEPNEQNHVASAKQCQSQSGIHKIEDAMRWPEHHTNKLLEHLEHTMKTDSDCEESDAESDEDLQSHGLRKLFRTFDNVPMSTAFSGIDAPGTGLSQQIAELNHRIRQRNQTRKERGKKVREPLVQHPVHLNAVEYFSASQEVLQDHPNAPRCLFGDITLFFNSIIRTMLPELYSKGKVLEVIRPLICGGNQCIKMSAA